MITVTVSRIINNLGRSEKTSEEKFDYYRDEDLSQFAKKVNETVFKVSEDSDEVLVSYRYLHKTEIRRIVSKSIRYLDDKSPIESRILLDLNEIKKKD